MKNKLIGVFLLLLGVIFLPTAVADLKSSLTNKTPTTVSFDAFQDDLPSEEGWFRITGAQLEVVESLYVDEGGTIGNIYVPARKAGSQLGSEAPIRVLVKVEDANIRALLEKVKAAEKKSPQAAEDVIFANVDKLQVARPLQGTIATGIDALDDKDASAIRASNAKLADDFVILQEGATPSVGGRVFLLLFGLALSLGGLFMILQKSPAKPSPAPPSSTETPQGPGPWSNPPQP